MIDPSIIFSNLLGGGIALVVSVGVSYWEYNRQQKQQDQNWYRSIHNTVLRCYGSRDIDMDIKGRSTLQIYSRQFESYSDILQKQISNAPEEVEFELFNSLENINSSCISYSGVVDSDALHRDQLNKYHDTIIDFSLIALYAIEEEISPDIEYLETLEDNGNREKAKELYQKFSEGTLYNEKSEQMKEFEELVEQQNSDTEDSTEEK